MSFKTSLVVICLGVITAAFLGCVDVPSDSPEFPDFRTQTRFINADPDLGTAQIMLEPTQDAGLQSFASVAFQEDTGYRDVAAGTRRAKVAADPDTASLSLQSDAVNTVMLFPRVDGSGRFRVFRERAVYQAVPDTAGQVRFISAATGDVTYDVLDAADSTSVGAQAEELGFRANSGYLTLDAGSYTFGVAEHGTDVFGATVDVTVSNGQRSTVVILGEAGAISAAAFQDDVTVREGTLP